MAKKTDKQSRIDYLSNKHSGIASLINTNKEAIKKIMAPLTEQKELTEYN